MNPTYPFAMVRNGPNLPRPSIEWMASTSLACRAHMMAAAAPDCDHGDCLMGYLLCQVKASTYFRLSSTYANPGLPQGGSYRVIDPSSWSHLAVNPGLKSYGGALKRDWAEHVSLIRKTWLHSFRRLQPGVPGRKPVMRASIIITFANIHCISEGEQKIRMWCLPRLQKGQNCLTLWTWTTRPRWRSTKDKVALHRAAWLMANILYLQLGWYRTPQGSRSTRTECRKATGIVDQSLGQSSRPLDGPQTLRRKAFIQKEFRSMFSVSKCATHAL